MSVFVDTNILLRVVQPTHILNTVAVRAVSVLIAQGEELVVTPQIMAEFWNAATRPQANNGVGMSPEKTAAEVARLENFFTLLDESAVVYEQWKDLVQNHRVSGVQAHDARLVAAMIVYGVSRILTFNANDFTRFKQIAVLDPGTV